MRRWLLLVDVAVVASFVAIGRETHDEGNALAGLAATAAPFLLALGVGWLATRAWRRPEDVRSGLVVLAATLVGGMLLRRFVFDDGTALPFVIVATVYLSLGMLGWRVAARAMAARPRPVSG